VSAKKAGQHTPPKGSKVENNKNVQARPDRGEGCVGMKFRLCPGGNDNRLRTGGKGANIAKKGSEVRGENKKLET